MPTPGKIYIVATPIGNPADITLRAIETLRQADAIICEEQREGSSLLKRLGISPRELILLNEHNEQELVPELVNRILLNGGVFALITDCGTPVFADPGHGLIRAASQMGITVSPVPGPSSHLAALSILDFQPERFYFGGFLPRPPEERRRELTRLRGLRIPVVLMDTPYRLSALLEDVGRAFGKGHQVTIAADLTLSSETILRGPVGELKRQLNNRKAEFILIIHS